VVAVIAFAASPPAAAMPQAAIDLAAAAEGAVKGAATMRLAGLFGVSGDVLITTGVFLLAMRIAGVAAAGWILIGLSTIVFVIVDAMVGFVLPPVAAASGASQSFLAVKQLFDILFLFGTAIFGAGAILATFDSAFGAGGAIARVLAVPAFATGVAAIVSGGGSLAGIHLEQFVGLGILGGSAIFTIVGLQMAFAPKRD